MSTQAPATPRCVICPTPAVALLVDTRDGSEDALCTECLAVYYRAREADEAKGIDFGPQDAPW